MGFAPDHIAKQLIEHDVVLVGKQDSWIMRAIGAVFRFVSRGDDWFMQRFYTTIKFPFCKPRIYPPSMERIDWGVIEHELVHVSQFKRWGFFLMALLYILLPLPFWFSGRWLIERRAFLVDIKAGRKTPKDAAKQMASKYYAWAWPYDMALKWFEEHSK